MKIFFLIVFVGTVLSTNAQTVNIPDQNFKNALLNHIPVIDTNADGEIQVSEAQAVTAINVQGKGIQDLTGIEAFVNITHLYCSNNLLTTLDLSQNTLLEYLYCSDNQLVSLNVSQCTELLNLFCGFNSLTSLDVSQNTELRELGVSNNQLTNLDVTQNTKLNYLLCISNQLTNLDLSKNLIIQDIDCTDNQLISLDISHNTNLWYLACAHNNITSIDLTQNTGLAIFAGQNNNLTSLDVRNGNNSIIQLFDTQQNPNLKCIFVEDATWSNNQQHWTPDPASTYVETQAQCDALGVTGLSSTQIQLYPNPVNNRFYITGTKSIPLQNIAVYDVLGNLIKTFPGELPGYDVSGLQKGVYFVKISNGEKSLNFKILKK